MTEQQAKRPSEVLAEQVKEWRRRRNLSAQQLADRIAELGGTLDRVAVSKLENGQRGVSLDEALMLADALNVPPPVLILGIGAEDRVAISDRSVIHPGLALEWFTGADTLAASNRFGASNLREWHEAAEPLRLERTHKQIAGQVSNADSNLRSAEYKGDERITRKARAEFADALRELAGIVQHMRGRGIEPAGMPNEWVDKMKELGFELGREVKEGDGGDDGER